MKKHQAEITEEPIMNEQDEAIIEIEELAEEFTDEAEKVNIVSKTVYKTFYAVSFGVVFSSLLVAKLLVPKNSMAAKGLHDGTTAAKKAVAEKEVLFTELAEQTEEILTGEEPSAVLQ